MKRQGSATNSSGGRGASRTGSSGRGGAGGGAAIKKSAQDANVGSASYTVREELRINFTRQLMKLREEEVNKVVFPTTLSNIERKFLHRLAEELGLKSKSTGKGEARAITVTKPNTDGANDGGKGPAMFQMSTRALDVLGRCFHMDVAVPLTSSTSSSSLLEEAGRDERSHDAAPSLEMDAAMVAAAYERAQAARMAKPSYEPMKAKRESLPAAQHKESVCSLIKDNQVLLVSGETGCGKTTQVPQFILDDPDIGSKCRIVVTQPRRLSAISVAERIAAERGEKIGETIGYNIRLESEKSRSTQVLFVTPGVLLRKMQNDPLLEEFSHIIIDEAHERDRFTEFLMIVLRDVCARRRGLKLVLMSATMHTNKLSSYFGGVPHIHMGGSVFPVQEFFLEHVLRFTDYCSRPGAINIGEGGADAFAAYVRSRQVYSCVWCGAGPFKSPEEVGTHVALCLPSEGNERKKKNIKKARQGASIDELVGVLSRMSSGAVRSGSPTPVSSPRPSGSSSSKVVVASAASTASSGKGTAALAAAVGIKISNKGGAAAKAAGGRGGGETAADGGEEEEEEEESDAALTHAEIDENLEGGGDVAPQVAIEKIDGAAAAAQDDYSGGDALLRQYQAQFDDATVDYDLILSLLRYVFESEFCKEGSVLIFMSGWDDISRMYRIINSTPDLGDERKYKLIQLHSGISKKAQDLVFEPLKPGTHKIILSTNIAETSVTIDDVVVVIDAGRMKEKTYDPHVKLAYLKSTWISQASARQRKGRAGRTRAGVCFHLFSKRRHASLPEFQDSELLRMPLEELVLQAKMLGLAQGKGQEEGGIKALMLKALDPPHELSIGNAVQLLQAINVLDANERVTPLGRAVSRLPLDPRISRVILLGCLCGCGPALLSTAAAMGYRDPFLMPANDSQRAECNKIKAQLAAGNPSDQIALLKAMDGFELVFARHNAGRAYEYCDQHYLSRTTMNYLRDLTQQLSRTVSELGINITHTHTQRNNGNVHLLMALIGIGLYPDVGVRTVGATTFTTEKGRKAKIHPGSLNSKNAAYKSPCKVEQQMDCIAYQDLVATTNNNNTPGAASLLMLNTTPISVFGLLLTCGSISIVEDDDEDEDEDGEGNGDFEDVEDADEEDFPSPPPPPSASGSAVTTSLSDIVRIDVDGWLTLALPRGVLNLISSCRLTLTQGIEKFVSDPATPLPPALMKGVDAIANALAIEQASVSQTVEIGVYRTASGGGGGGGGGRGGK